MLKAIARRRPTLLVIEDLHWADAPTLLLLRQLARLGSAGVLFLATFRDTEVEVSEVLSEALADLRRYDTIRLELGGLSGEAVADFVRSAAGVDVAPDLQGLAQTIRDLTDGNAFLVCELWRALIETDGWRSSTGRCGSPARWRSWEPGERARGRQPTALSTGPGHQRPARAGGHSRGGVPARRGSPCRGPRRSPSSSSRSTKRSAAG